jgi:hypothetical protein
MIPSQLTRQSHASITINSTAMIPSQLTQQSNLLKHSITHESRLTLLPALVKAYLASSFQQGSEPRVGDVEPRWKGRGWSRWTMRFRRWRGWGSDNVVSREVATMRRRHWGRQRWCGVGVEGGDDTTSREAAPREVVVVLCRHWWRRWWCRGRQ